MSLSNLVQFATKANSGNGKTPFYALSIEEARAAVSIRDSRKPANIVEGAPVPLALYAGKIRVSLDIISEGATAITVPVEEVEAVEAQLREAIDAGEFDVAITDAQAKGEEAAKKAQATKANSPVVTEEVAGDVDLDELG